MDESVTGVTSARCRKTLTLLTVALNCRDLFVKTAESLPSTLPAGIHWIVVDGGSTDGTAEQIRLDARVTRSISEPDNGVYDAYNKALDMADTDYVSYLNCGDTLASEAIQALDRALDAGDASSMPVHCFSVRMCSDRGFVWRPLPDELHERMSVPTPGVLFPRAALVAAGGFDPGLRIASDYEALLKLQTGGNRFVVHDAVLVDYLGGGLSTHYDTLGFFEECVVQLRNKVADRDQVLLRAARHAVSDINLDAIPYARWKWAMNFAKKLLY